MQNQMSEHSSVISLKQLIIDEVKAEEEKKISASQAGFYPTGHEEDEKKEDNDDSDKEEIHVFYKSDDLIHQPKSAMRNWLRKTGKSKYIDFDESQMAILNDCFQELDEDGSKAIGVDELEDPLIALGLVDSRTQVEQMVHEIDDDGNIEFEEFLKLVKGGKKTKQTF